jgi:hypothetical protein
LASYPDLFLRFARLADDGLDNSDELDTDHNANVMREWVDDYGVLGLTLVKLDPGHAWAAVPTGGEGDTVAAFVREAKAANRALRLYEAATAPGGIDFETIAALFHSGFTRGKLAEIYSDSLKKLVRREVSGIIQERHHFYHQAPYELPDGRSGIGSAFINLLGAMWLQMLWLLGTRDEPRRCKLAQFGECDRIITLAPPEQIAAQSSKRNDRSAGYRTRSDKIFCSKTHNNRYNYLTRVKPRRQQQREP